MKMNFFIEILQQIKNIDTGCNFYGRAYHVWCHPKTESKLFVQI